MRFTKVYWLLTVVFSSCVLSQEGTSDDIQDYVIHTEAKLKSFLSRFMPSIIAIRNANADASELPEDFANLKTRLFMKGIKVGLFMCDSELPKDATSLFVEVGDQLCSPFGESWRYLALPYFESEELSAVAIESLDEVLSADMHESVKAFISKRLSIVESDSFEFYFTMEEAARKVVNSYAKSVVVLQEEHVPSFISNVAEFGQVDRIDGAKRDSFPLVFFAEEKVKQPPQILQALAAFTSGIAQVGFVHAPQGVLLRNLGLPAEMEGKNIFLVFAIVDGQIRTFMYDKSRFGKFSAVSMFGFFLNVVNGEKLPNSELTSFDIWQSEPGNMLRTPVSFQPTEKATEIGAGGFEAQPAELTLEKQLVSESFMNTCMPAGEGDRVPSLCVLLLIDKAVPGIEESLAKFASVQEEFFSKSGLLGKNGVLPFRFSFGWVDSACNPNFMASLEVDITSLPLVTGLFFAQNGKTFHLSMVKAFKEDNVRIFLRELFQYRKLLTSDSEDDKFKKYIQRFRMVDEESLRSIALVAECELGQNGEEDEDMAEMLREIREEEERERQLREEEARKEEAEKKKGKKKKKKKRKKKSKREL